VNGYQTEVTVREITFWARSPGGGVVSTLRPNGGLPGDGELHDRGRLREYFRDRLAGREDPVDPGGRLTTR
jgi:hypothetical protein